MFHCRDGGFEESSQEQLSPSMSYPDSDTLWKHTHRQGMYGWTIHTDLQPARPNHVIDFEFRKHFVSILSAAGVVKRHAHCNI